MDLEAIPRGVVTVISFTPTVPAGVTAVTDVGDTTTTLVACASPTVTLDAPVKFVPVMVMVVPPNVEPEVGLTLVIVEVGATYVNALGLLMVPSGVVSATSFAPAVPAGVMAVTDVGDTTTTLVAATPPTVTLFVLVKFVPVIVNSVPPKVEPEVGLNELIVGLAGVT